MRIVQAFLKGLTDKNMSTKNKDRQVAFHHLPVFNVLNQNSLKTNAFISYSQLQSS